MRPLFGSFFLLALLLSAKVFGQELIPNGGFETYRTCPWKDNLLEEAAPWYNPNLATPDVYHRCSSETQAQMELPPRTGQGLSRLLMDLNWAEYLATPLKEPLRAGETYHFEMYMASTRPSQYPSGSFGAIFTNQPITSKQKGLLAFPTRPQVIDVSPRRFTQRLRWEEIAGCFTATGNERYATIGNFYELPQLLGDYYLFVDNVSLKPVRLNLGRDTTLCGRRATHLLDATTPGGTDYRWNTGSTSPTLRVTKPGKYWVTVKTFCKELRDTITVDYRLSFSLGRDTTICDTKTLPLRVDTPGTFRWQDGSEQNTFNVKQSGQYWVRATDGSCSAADTVAVRYMAPPQLDLGADQSLCGAEVYTIRPTHAQGTFRWLDSLATPDRTVTTSGVFRASVTNDCATLMDEVTVDYSGCPCQVYAPDAFSPNADGNNDIFEPFACGDITFTALTIYNRWGEIVFFTDKAPFRWDGTYRGERSPTAIYTWHLDYALRQGDQPPLRKVKQSRLTLIGF